MESNVYICFKCDKPIDKSKIIGCRICENMFHNDCVGVEKQWLKTIAAVERLCWFCDYCHETWQPIAKERSAKYLHEQEINRDRVPMDFSDTVGRVVTDPVEASNIAISESHSWKRKWLSSSRFSFRKSQDESSDSGVHLTQPWFHKGLTREQATALLNKSERIEGLFIVRDSSSTRGCIVVSYRSGNKVIHTPITKVKDRLSKETVYTVNNGKVKFYDIVQLIEFHQLNASELPTRLTYYILKNTTTIVPALSPQKAVKDQEQPSTSGSQGSPTKGSPTKGSPTKASPTKASTSKNL